MKPERWKQIDQLLEGALDRPPGERAAFLNQACAGDTALRREVESLLSSDGQAGSFIEAPAFEVAAEFLAEDQTQTLVGQHIGRYRVLSLLGRGGMGEVYLAQDSRLGRQVALKLLPASFTNDQERVRRFEQEARAASRLSHPNICVIHEVGETDDGRHFITMEYIDGVTLRQHMTNPQMRLGEAVDIAIQAASGLSAAHQAGIVHRDIKPENIMVRPDGLVKVLDFGLAKLAERPAATPETDTQAETIVRLSTEPGMVMGTASYMSPEQARGLKVDHRTDIFSLGVALYEMVAGRPPFEGATASETIAAVLRDEPPPLAEAPPALEHIVSRALRKDSAERYQTAKTLLDDLNQLKEQLLMEKLVVPPSVGSSRSRKLPPEGRTANKHRLLIALASASAILIIAALAAWLYFYRAPVLTEKDTILLADFDNKTGDAIFDGTLKQGLAIQLQQWPFVHIFSEARVRQTLRLMNHPPNERVTAEIAREICERQGIKALIAGSIAPLGSHYVITLEAIDAQNGETLARQQAKAESREQVLQALSQAATGLREKLGESLSLLQKLNQPLDQTRTSKLEALKDATKARELAIQGRFVEAIPFFKRAVEIDPQYAHALAGLAVMNNVTGQPESAAKYAEQAFLLRDRGSESERLDLTCWYHIFVTGNQNMWLEALRMQKQADQTFAPAYHNLALAWNMVGQSEQAVAEEREALRLNPNLAAAYRVLSLALLRLNRFAEAKETIRQAQQRKLEETEYHLRLYQLAFIAGDTAEMRRQVEGMSGNPEEYAALDWQTSAAAFAGQWRKAQELSRRAIDLAAQVEMKEVAARYGTEQALRCAVFGECRQARADAMKGLALERGRASAPRAAPALAPRAALALALCGAANQVTPLIDDLTKRYPEDTVINSIWLPAIRAALELQRGNAALAVDQLQTTSRYEAAASRAPDFALRFLRDFPEIGRQLLLGTKRP